MINGRTRLAAVLGWPVTHSRSPQMMNAAFAAIGLDAALVPMGVRSEGLRDVVAALRAVGALGASVTTPHKLSVMALCDDVAPAAREIGAVNCLHIDDGRVIGHNTDAPGYVASLVEAGVALAGKRAVILGAGGAARAVAYGLRGEGCTVEVIARRPEEITWEAARAWTEPNLRDAFASADGVVDCTPIGLAGDEPAWVAALPLDALPAAAWISTLIYHRTTLLLERMAQRGHVTVDGRGMLVHQAAHAFRHWTGRQAPIDAMYRAVAISLAGT